MNKKLILIIFCLFLVFFSISFSFASNSADNETVYASDFTYNETISASGDEVVEMPEEQEILSDSGSFTELNAKITISSDKVNLEKNYTYLGGTDHIDIAKDITIEGNYNTIDGSNQASIFTVKGSHHVILQNIIFKNAYGVNGSAVNVESGSSVEIINCTFINNNASQFGGAVYFVAETSALTSKIVNSVFESNSASVHGGAVYINSDDAILEDLTFKGNYAEKDGAALYVAGDYCNLANSTFSSNTAGDDGPAVYWEGSNGLIYNITCTNNKGISKGTSSTRGGTAILTGSNVTVRKSSFADSIAGFDGGAIFITGNDINIIDCDFDNCTARDEHGGALYIIGNNTKVLDCDFKNCNANLSGGVIYVVGNDVVIDHASFTRNGANLDGGALFVNGTNCILSNSTFLSNVAGDDGGAVYWNGDNGLIYNIECIDNKGISDIDPQDGTRSNSKGGTICLTGSNVTIDNSSFIKSSAVVDGGALFITGNDVNVYNSTFADCISTNSSGGAIYIIGNDTDVIDCYFAFCRVNNAGNNPRGGAIYIEGNNGNISRSSFESTSALIGGAIFIAGDDTVVDDSSFLYTHAKGANIAAGGTGGAVYVEGGGAIISNSDFAYGEAINYGGAIAIWGPNALITKNTFDNSSTSHYYGGSIFVSGVNTTISLSNFTRSKATYKDATGAATGGAIEVYGSETNILDCNFEDCFAYYGGVIHIKGENAFVNGSNFSHNGVHNKESPYRGAAIFVEGANSIIAQSNFTDLKSKDYGGAIYVQGENTLIDSSYFDKCNSKNGGDIYVFGNYAKIENSIFNSSTAENGGAIYLDAWGALIKSSDIANCTATNSGGAIYVAGGGTNIVESNFNDCLAKGTTSANGGGAIYVNGPDTHISASNFNNNKVDGGAYGGTIYINGSRTFIDGSNFNNSFAGRGGVIFIQGENTIVNASSLANSSSSGFGGAIAVYGHKATIEWSSFDNISAKDNGGAIYVDGEDTNILHSSFYNCTNDNKLGGAIYIDDVGTTVAYSNFTLSKSGTAGAIYINGVNTSILYCNLHNNSATSAGAIKVFGNNTIISNSNFTYNNATTSSGGALDIGGSNASVYSCWFDRNDAKTNGGAINWIGGHGDDSIIGSTFTHNRCYDIRNGGGAIFWTASSEKNIGSGGLILNSIFINNTAFGHHGGAIDWYHALDSTINNCLFVNNTAYGDGGALYTGDQGGHGQNLTMTNCQFYNNTAKKHGGAIANQMRDSWIYNNTFDGNKAQASGGTILMKENGATNSVIDHCYIYNSFINQTYSGNNYGLGGGAIRIGVDDNITISNCAIINSTANRTYGGAISIDSGSVGSSLINVTIQNAKVLDGYGGAICWAGPDATLNNVTIFNSSTNAVSNAYSANGGAIYLSALNCSLNDIKIFTSSTNIREASIGKTGQGGAIYVAGDSNNLTNVKIDGSSTSCVRMNGHGGAIYWAGSSGKLVNATISNTLANGQGGAIYWSGGSPTVENISIEYSQTNVTNSANNAANGGAIYSTGIDNLRNVYIENALASTDSGDVRGGAIYYTGTYMDNVTVIGSRASTDEGISRGGAVYWQSGSNGTMNKSSFKQNTADLGGALFSDRITYINDTSFKGNVANDGGALYSQTGDDILTNASFEANSAKRGGAIFAEKVHLKIYNSTLEFNTAEQKGGAIYRNYANKDGQSIFVNTNLVNNTAFQGSAIYANNLNNFALKDVVLLDNQANAHKFIEKAIGVDENGNNYTKGTFLGFDNLLNSIWQEAKVALSCDNVTYWGVNGINVISSSPVQSDREVWQNVTVEMFNENGEKINESTVITDDKGTFKYIFNAEPGKTYYFAYRHDTDRYYTYLRETLSNRSLVKIYVDDLYYGQNATMLIYLTDGAWGDLNGTVTVKFNDTNNTTFTIDVVNGTYKTNNISGLPVGHYNATISFDGDLNHTGSTDWDLFAVLPIDDLHITKDVNITADYVNVTDIVKYTINVTNHGPSKAMGVNVTEKLSPYLKLLNSTTNNHGIYNESAGYWYIGDLEVDELATLTIIAQVIHIGPITNTVWVTGEGNDTNISNDIDSARNFTALPIVDLRIIKEVNTTADILNVLDIIKFNITVFNDGPCNATGVYVDEMLDFRLSMLSCNATKGRYENGTWNIGVLNAGENATLTIVAQVVYSGNISNAVVVYSYENDTNLTNNRDAIKNITAIANVDLGIIKIVNVTGFVNVTDKIKFTITVYNRGPCNATGVYVGEVLSNHLKMLSSNATKGKYDGSTWVIDNLNKGEVQNLTIIAEVISSGNISNAVAITGNDNDTNKSNNNDSIKNITAVNIVDLQINKTVNVKDAVTVGDTIIFTITVKNNGPCDATGVNVTEVLSPHLKLKDNITWIGHYDVKKGVWYIGNLTKNDWAQLIIEAEVVSPGNISNVVVVSSNENDTNKSNNRDNITNITALPVVDLNITKTVNVTTGVVNVSDRIKFTITVHNNGPCNTTNVVVVERLSNLLKVEPKDITASEGKYNLTSGLWTIERLNNNSSATLTIVAKVIGNGTIGNVVVVNSTENDTDPSNNKDSIDNITALPIVDLRIVKKVNVTQTNVEVMDIIKFTITVFNDGPCNATGVYVEEPLSPLLKLIKNETKGTYDGYTWFIGNMANGTNATLTIIAQIIYSGNIINAVTVFGDQNDTNYTNNKDNITPLNASAHVDLGIMKRVNVTSGVVYVGELIEFTVIAYNNGPCNATGVFVQEPLDPHLELVSYTVTSSRYPDRNDTTYINKYTWNIGSLDKGELLTLKIVARVMYVGNFSNAVVISGYDNDTDISNNNASIKNITALALVDVEINKTVNVTTGTVYLGDKVKFTITVHNKGPCDATGVWVREALDFRHLGSDYSYDATGGTTYDGYTWNIGNLAKNATAVLTIIANLTSLGNFSNDVFVNVTEHDTNMSNNNDSIDNITVLPVVDVRVNKTVNVTKVNVTEYVKYTINVVNLGPSKATDVNVSEHLSPLVKLIGVNADVGTYNNSTNIWNIPVLEVNVPVRLELTVQVIRNGTVENIVTVTSNETDKNKTNNNYTSENVTALPIVDVKVNKTVNATKVNINDLVEYIITVKNDGPSNATGVNVTDRLDSRLSFVSFDSSRRGITYDSSTGMAIIGDLNVNETVILTIIAKVSGVGVIPNNVNVTSKENDTNPSNNFNSSDNVTVNPIVDVQITKKVNATLVNVTDLIEYTITVYNDGPSNATAVNVTDKLDSHLKFVSFDSSRSGIVYDDVGGIVTIGNLNTKETVILKIVARVMSVGNIVNVANVTSKENDTNKSNNNCSSDNVTALPIVDVKVNKTVNATKVLVNDLVKYIITVKNDGPSNATGVIVTDRLDSRLSFVSFDSSRSGVTYDNMTKTFYIGNLNVNETVILTIIAKVSGVGVMPNNVNVTSKENDTNPSNNFNSSDNITALPIVDVKVNKTVSVSEVKLGDEFIYVIIVHNNGPSAASDVNVTEKLSDYVSLISFKATKGNYSESKNSWYIGNLTKGETHTLTLNVKVIGVGVIENTVFVTSNETDTNLTNNNYTCENVTVLNFDTPIDLDCYDIYYGDDEIITVTLPVNATGTVNVTVGVRHYDDVPIDNGRVKLPVYDLGGGDYNVTVIYGGDGIYNPNSTSGKFTVHPVTPIITIEVEDIWVGEVEILNVTVNAPGTVFVTVNGVTVEIPLDNGVVTTGILAAVKNSYLGNATWNIWGLPVGPYPAFALYPGNENYTSVNTTDLFHVRDKPSTVVVTADDIYVGEDAVINIKVGPEGVSGNVSVTLEGKTYIVAINENGEAQLIVSGLKAGLKKVTVEYEGTILYRPSENETTFKVLKLKPPVDVVAPEITVGEDGVITVTVPEDATGTITIEIEGKRYTAPIKDGKAVFVIPGLKVGIHDIKVFYSGDDKYLPANTTGSIKVNPKDEPGHNKTTHKKVGLEVHETGNPILLVMLAVLSCGVAQIRRFKK